MTARMTLAIGLASACTAASVPAALAAEPVRIHDIQGTTRVSELAGQQVSDVPGVVTGVRSFGDARGFWFQDTQPDGDPRTSEGLFVYTGSTTPDVTEGDAVTVSGEVGEYYADDVSQSVTQLTGAKWQVTGQEEVPAAEPVTPDAVPEGYAPNPGSNGDIDDLPLQPDRFALDYYESREGMNLSVRDARVVGPTDQYNSLWLTTKPQQNPTERGGTAYTSYDAPNSGRLKLESLIPLDQRPFPKANVGDQLRGTTSGPLDYSAYGGYVLQAATLGEHAPGDIKPESVDPQGDGQLSVATYNVENLSAADEQGKFDRLAEGIANNLAAPDIVALEEVQDNNGATDDGEVNADGTLKRFTDAIADAGGPRYQWRQIDPQNNADGGEPGGNIRVAFLFNPDRVSFVDREGGDATTPVRAEQGKNGPKLSVSPGRIEPDGQMWRETRKPLAGEFTFQGRTVFVVANHFSSKGGDQPLHGRFQPPERSSEQQRIAQAQSVRGFVDELRAIDDQASIVVAGDLNDFGFSPALQALTEGDALNAPERSLPERERYGYVYEGNSQALDHILTSPGMGEVSYDIVHVNAEFADQASDHDPQLLRTKG